MTNGRKSSSSQYVNHAFHAEVHALPPDGAKTAHAAASGENETKTKRAPFRRQDSFPAMAANALTTMSPPATSSDADEHSRNVNDLAEFWREYKRSRKYEHPFGKKADLLGQILCGEREESSENQTDSPAKLLIWMVFFCFMVGVAGAIILGAETAIRNTPGNQTLTTANPGT